MPHTIEIIFRSILMFGLLFVFTKLLKKKQLVEFKILDYMTSIVLGSIAAIHASTTDLYLGNGIVSMTVWFIIAYIFQYLSYYFSNVNRLQGQQTVIIKNGEIFPENMKKERYPMADLHEDLRAKNVYDISQVEYAVLEPSGKLNVLLKKPFRPLTEQSFKKINE